MTAEPNVTTPTPDELEAIRELARNWAYEVTEQFVTTDAELIAPFRVEGSPWTPVDEHDEGPP